MASTEISIRQAAIADVKVIHGLLDHFAGEGLLLGRSLSSLYDQLRDFLVAEVNGELVGACALHICWEDLAEIRSLAVAQDFQAAGVGRSLVESCLDEAARLGLTRVFTLTYRPDFFSKQGFVAIDKSELPHKVWSDCVNCPKFPDCNEEAMIWERG
ncbi:MAG: N-acetyltransferase [Thermodesulfobacteriota bacterium]